MPTRLLITTGIFPPDIGGPATQIEQLASDLAKNGFDVAVLTYGTPEEKQRLFKLASVSKKIPRGLRQAFFGFKAFLSGYSADVIYATDLYSVGFFSMLASKFWRKKFVVRFAGDSAWETAFNRGLTQDNILTFQEKIYADSVEKLKKRRAKILKSADAVIAVSGFMKNLAEKIGVSPEKIRVIYNAVDFFGAMPEKTEPAVPTLVYSGRLTPWKGVDMLIEIVAELKKEYPDITFEIIGEGTERKNLEKSALKLGLEKNVYFRGKMSESETHEIFSHSTIFVLNTDYEGLSHAILNAMNVGVPVITTPVGGNPEVVQNEYNGLLVAYNDKKTWRGAIERLLDDKALREKFSQNGKKTLSKFRWAELVEKTAEVLKTV